MTIPPPSIPKRRGSWKRLFARTTVFVVVLGLCLLALELATRAIYNRDGMHFSIEMWKYAKQLKRTSSNYDMGHEHVPNSEAFLMGVPVKINSAGLRDREFTLDKPEGTYRILCLGDSTTLGWGVEQDKTYAKLLETRLNDRPLPGKPRHFEVMNTGVGNYNTAQEVAYFKERGHLYNPDLVTLGFYINDAEVTPRETTNWLARNSCLYVFTNSALDSMLRRMDERPNYRDYYRGLYEKDQPGWIACQRALRELMARCAANHTELAIVLIPELHTVGADYEFRQVHDLVRQIGKEGGVPVLDLVDSVAGQEPTTLWVSPEDAHPNARAMELFAAQLDTALRSNLVGGRQPSEMAPVGSLTRP